MPMIFHRKMYLLSSSPTRFAGVGFKKTYSSFSRWRSYSSCRHQVLVVSYFSVNVAERYFPALNPIAARKPRRKLMERPRAISFAVVVFTILAGGALLLEH